MNCPTASSSSSRSRRISREQPNKPQIYAENADYNPVLDMVSIRVLRDLRLIRRSVRGRSLDDSSRVLLIQSSMTIT
jgi:hypothetical protein